MTHTCIKCGKKYEDAADDDYYCPVCLEQKQSIARQVDLQVGSTVGQKPGGELKAYDEAIKKSGRHFPPASLLGIK